MANRQHVYPTFTREHITDDRDCWCGPDIYRLCPECGEPPDGGEAGCWFCLGQQVKPLKGLVLVTDRYEIENNEAPLVIVHQEGT